MRNRVLKALFISAAVLCATPGSAVLAQSSKSPETVTIADGALKGRVTDGVLVFRGIPFAAPPVGPLRWRPPQPVTPWSGVRDASLHPNDCMQRSTSVFARGTTEPSEDCLYLNVFRSADEQAGPLPVMVYIHGGGFTQGGSSATVYQGNSLAKKGVIVVTVNYRLGRLGFFAHPALTAEHPDEVKGNYAFMDQIAALKWVQANIAAFGGDPKNVTIFGQSAGGVSVDAMVVSPLAKGLFQKAIVQSGPARMLASRKLNRDLPGSPSLETFGKAFAEFKGIAGSGPDAAAKLRALPAEAFMNTAEGRPTGSGADGLRSWGGAVADGKLLPDIQGDYFQTGQFTAMPMIVGANTEDAVGTGDGVADPLSPFGARRKEAEKLYDPEGSGNVASIARQVAGDTLMVEPSRKVTIAVASKGAPVYGYRFGYITENLSNRWVDGSPHGAELAYVFDRLADYYGPAATKRDFDFANLITAYWVNFAKRGDPNGAGLPAWPRYDAKDQLMIFGDTGASSAAPDPWRARLDLVAASKAGN